MQGDKRHLGQSRLKNATPRDFKSQPIEGDQMVKTSSNGTLGIKSGIVALGAMLLMGLGLNACSSGGGSGGGGTGGGVGSFTGCGASPALPANHTGGCRIRMVTPANCESIDLSGGKSYEVAWTTDGTTCETPFTIILAGNPPGQDNVFEFTVNTNGSTITTKGGILNVTASDFDGVPTQNGHYHWVVRSFHGSHPASQEFQVRK